MPNSNCRPLPEYLQGAPQLTDTMIRKMHGNQHKKAKDGMGRRRKPVPYKQIAERIRKCCEEIRERRQRFQVVLIDHDKYRVLHDAKLVSMFDDHGEQLHLREELVEYEV